WRALVRKAHGKRSNQNYRSRALLVFGGTIVGKAARTMRDPAAPFQTTSLNDAYVLAAMRVCARRSRHSFARCHFRIQRMLSQHEMLPQIENPKARPNKTRYRANWLPRNWLTGHCASATLPRSFLLCLSNLFGLVLLGSCFLSQVHRPRVPYCRESSRMLRGIRFKARISGLKRQTLADCSRQLKRM